MVLTEKFFFVCGPHASGKTTICNKLIDYGLNALHLECGPSMRELHRQSGSELPMHDWILMCKKEFGEHYCENQVRKTFYRQIRLNPHCDWIIISGARSMEHIYFLGEPEGITDPVIIYIDAEADTLKKNYEKRIGREIGNEAFQELLAHDLEMGLGQIREYVLKNTNKCLLLENKDNQMELDLHRIIAFITQVSERV